MFYTMAAWLRANKFIWIQYTQENNVFYCELILIFFYQKPVVWKKSNIILIKLHKKANTIVLQRDTYCGAFKIYATIAIASSGNEYISNIFLSPLF